MSAENVDEIKEDSARKAHYDDLWDRTPSAKVTVDGQETTEYFRVFWKNKNFGFFEFFVFCLKLEIYFI